VQDIGVKIRVDREQELRRNIGKNSLPSGMRNIVNITEAGNLKKSIKWFRVYADIFETLDIQFNKSFGTVSEYYALMLDAISRASTNLLTRTNIIGANNVSIVGGSGLEKIFNLANSGTNTNTSRKNLSNANSFRKIGNLNGDYPSYFYPNYDTENPKCKADGTVSIDNPEENVYDSITIVGMPIDPAKALVVKGIPEPLIPRNVKMNANMEVTMFIHGQIILAPNKNPKSKQLSTKILFKS